MAEVEGTALTGQMHGKLSQDSKESIRRGPRGMHTYRYKHPKKNAPTEGEKQSRANLKEAQAYYDSIKKDAEQLALWRRRFYEAGRENEKHPGRYANMRRSQLEAEGKRVREKQLEFPVTLHGYVLSCYMQGEKC